MLQQNSLCFPCLEKSKNQIPCFPCAVATLANTDPFSMFPFASPFIDTMLNLDGNIDVDTNVAYERNFFWSAYLSVH